MKNTLNTYLGSARSLFPWTALDSTKFLGVGTNVKYYVLKEMLLMTLLQLGVPLLEQQPFPWEMALL